MEEQSSRVLRDSQMPFGCIAEAARHVGLLRLSRIIISISSATLVGFRIPQDLFRLRWLLRAAGNDSVRRASKLGQLAVQGRRSKLEVTSGYWHSWLSARSFHKGHRTSDSPYHRSKSSGPPCFHSDIVARAPLCSRVAYAQLRNGWLLGSDS